MTEGELVKIIRKRKERFRNIKVAQVIFANLVYERYGITPINVDLLDKNESQLSEVNFEGGD